VASWSARVFKPRVLLAASGGVLPALLLVAAGMAAAQQGVRNPSIDRPVTNELEAPAGTTIPTWSGSFTTGGTTYTYAMIGTDPSKGSATTTVSAILIPVKLIFSDGTVLDPSAPVYGQTKSSVQLVQASPMFHNVAYKPGGTSVGTTQYIDAFQRANFWNYVSKSAPKYHVIYSLTTLAQQTLTVPGYFGYTQSGPGNRVGYVNASWLSGQISVMMYRLKIQTNTVPLFLAYDTRNYDGTLIFGGFHNAFGSPSQVYAEASFYDNALFPTTGDIMTLSHEMGELTDNPFYSNPVPAWSNPQTPGQCSNLLKVGDPVNDIGIAPVTLNGFTYHLEDLTFLPWFALESPSTSVNGWYTFGDYYTSPATCTAAAGRVQ